MPVDGLEHAPLTGEATAVFLRHDHLDDLSPARDQFAKRLGFAVSDAPGGRADGFGEMGNDGASKDARLSGACDHRLPAWPDANVQPILRHIDSNKHIHLPSLHMRARDAAPATVRHVRMDGWGAKLANGLLNPRSQAPMRRRGDTRSLGSEPEGTWRSRSRQAPYVPRDRFARSLSGRTCVSRHPYCTQCHRRSTQTQSAPGSFPAQIRHFAPAEALCREGERAYMPIWIASKQAIETIREGGTSVRRSPGRWAWIGARPRGE